MLEGHRQIVGGRQVVSRNAGGGPQRDPVHYRAPLKGLEFRHVYLIGMALEVFPSYRALQRGPQSKEVEEERRSCFVAVTRAREYFGYGNRASQLLGVG